MMAGQYRSGVEPGEAAGIRRTLQPADARGSRSKISRAASTGVTVQFADMDQRRRLDPGQLVEGCPTGL
jgi:hypothetical protein